MNIGDIIWEIQHVTRFSQVKLAKEVGCSSVTISRLFRGESAPSYENANAILALAKKYKIKVDVTLDDLVFKRRK